MNPAHADTVAALTDLFRRTGSEHHQAFLATDGDDPEWPIWYAERLQAPLGALLGAEITVSDLVYLLVRLSHEHPLDAPGSPWPGYYARSLVVRYLG